MNVNCRESHTALWPFPLIDESLVGPSSIRFHRRLYNVKTNTTTKTIVISMHGLGIRFGSRELDFYRREIYIVGYW